LKIEKQQMASIVSYMFSRIIDVLLLVAIVYGIQKNFASGMKMNIEDHGNLTFVLTLGFSAFFAGMAQAKLENR